MTRYWIITIAFFAALRVLGGLTASTLGEESSEWVVRTVASGVSAENVDVMMGLGGEIIVGYATLVPASVGNVTVARLPAGEESFQYHTELGGGNVASFAADPFGNVFYASHDFTEGGMRVGQDFGGYGDLLSSYHPDSGTTVPSAAPTIAVNPSGMPVVSAMDQSGARLLSTFNAIEAQWQTETVTGLGLDSPATPVGPNCQSLAFDSSGNPVLTYVRQTGDPAGPLVVALRRSYGWENVADDQAVAWIGTSTATALDGSIGFVYVDEDGFLSFNSYGDVLGVRETISSSAWNVLLTPHSLAFDNAGNPAVIYSLASTAVTPLHLARRDALGQWTDEVLPVDGSFASLTFDQWGEPLIAASSYDGITLLSKSVVPEPGTFLLTIMGAFALIAYGWSSHRACFLPLLNKLLLPKIIQWTQ